MKHSTFEINESTTRATLIALTTFYAMVLTPFTLYYARTLWLLNTRDTPFIHKRRPHVVLLSVLLLNLYTIGVRPTADFLILSGVQCSYLYYSPFILPVITLRAWLSFFDYHRSLQTLSTKWATQINDECHTTHVPWTTRYKWMGKVKTLFIPTLIVYIILQTLIIVCYVSFGSKAVMHVRVCANTLFIVFIGVLIYNIRTCRDQFCIQKEFKWMMLWMVLNLFMYILTMLCHHRVFESNVHMIISNVWMAVVCYVLCFLQTSWVIRRFIASRAFDETATVEPISLEELLKTQDGFEVFANHLMHEFSIENLFFVFEIMQTKHEMVMDSLVSEDEIGYVIPFQWKNMDQIIRRGTMNDVNDLRHTVRHIMDQYIASESHYCVNLSAPIRNQILVAYANLEGGGKLVVEAEIVYEEEDDTCVTGQTEETESRFAQHFHDQPRISRVSQSSIDFGKINDVELNKRYVVLFDYAIKEIMQLLKGDSLRRFHQTREYKTMMKKRSN
eukprot:7583_1